MVWLLVWAAIVAAVLFFVHGAKRSRCCYGYYPADPMTRGHLGCCECKNRKECEERRP